MNTFKQNKQWEQNIKALPVEDTTWIQEQLKEETEAMAELQAPGDVWTKHFRYNPEFPVTKSMRLPRQ